MNLFTMRHRALHHPTHPLKDVNQSKCPLEDLIAWMLRHEWGPWSLTQITAYQERMLEIDRRFTNLMAKRKKNHG